MADTNEIIGILDDTSDMTGTLDGDLIRGYSAYEIYLENGGTMTEEKWLESLKGKAPEITADRTGSKMTTVYADGIPIANILDGFDGADGRDGAQALGYYFCSEGEYDPATGVPTVQDPSIACLYATPGTGSTFNLYQWKNNAYAFFKNMSLANKAILG